MTRSQSSRYFHSSLRLSTSKSSSNHNFLSGQPSINLINYFPSTPCPNEHRKKMHNNSIGDSCLRKCTSPLKEHYALLKWIAISQNHICLILFPLCYARSDSLCNTTSQSSLSMHFNEQLSPVQANHSLFQLSPIFYRCPFWRSAGLWPLPCVLLCVSTIFFA